MDESKLIEIFKELIAEELGSKDKHALIDMCVSFVIATTDFSNPSEMENVGKLCIAYLKKKGAQVKGDKLALPKSPITEEIKMSCFDELYDHLDNVAITYPNIGLTELDQTATLVDLLKGYLFTTQVPYLAIQNNKMFLSWAREDVIEDIEGRAVAAGYDLVAWFEEDHLFFEVSSESEIIDAGEFFLKDGSVDDSIVRELSAIIDNVTCEFS